MKIAPVVDVKTRFGGYLRQWRIILLILVLSVAQSSTGQVKSSTCPPAMRLGSVLEGVAVSNAGVLTLGKFYAVCLPDPPRQSSSAYQYDPDDGGKFSTVLKTPDGQVLAKYVWYAEKVSTLWEIARYKVLGGHSAISSLVPGNYVLDFEIEDKPFYRLPFSVSMGKNDDIYNPGVLFFLDGPWSDYGVISYPNVNRYMQFAVWLRSKEKPSKKETHYDLKLVRRKDGKVLAGDWGDDAAVILKPGWIGFNLYLNRLNGERPENGSTEFPVAEVLKADGDYAVLLSLEGKPYGEYPFTVKGGAILYQGNQLPETADRLSYFDGGRNSYWLKRRATK
jgi:hypothetical protein